MGDDPREPVAAAGGGEVEARPVLEVAGEAAVPIAPAVLGGLVGRQRETAAAFLEGYLGEGGPLEATPAELARIADQVHQRLEAHAEELRGQFPFLAPGDPVSIDSIGGATIPGAVVDWALDNEGRLVWLAIDQEAAPMAKGSGPLVIQGAVIAVWRRGVPIRQPRQIDLALPAARGGLLGPDGRRRN